jgi:hypothetical protein
VRPLHLSKHPPLSSRGVLSHFWGRFSGHIEDFIPGEVNAVDEAGTKDPLALMLSQPLAMTRLSCARLTHVRVILGMLVILFAIALLCVLYAMMAQRFGA